MQDLLFLFLTNILSEGMEHDGIISIFKILDMFFETCPRFGTDNGTDTFEKENMNLRNSVSVFAVQRAET